MRSKAIGKEAIATITVYSSPSLSNDLAPSLLCIIPSHLLPHQFSVFSSFCLYIVALLFIARFPLHFVISLEQGLIQ